MKLLRHHWEWDVDRLSVEAAMGLFELSKSFPRDETYSLTDQGRRSSRSVSGQIAEAWGRRRYEAVFVNKLNEAEGEAGETQVWLEHAVKCGYLERGEAAKLHRTYDKVIGKLAVMENDPEPWLLSKSKSRLLH